MDFDHIDDDLLDGCGFDGNVLVPANEVGGVAEYRFAQPRSETETRTVTIMLFYGRYQ